MWNKAKAYRKYKVRASSLGMHTQFLSDTEERLTVLPECELFKRQALSSTLLVLHNVMERDACLKHFCTWEKNQMCLSNAPDWGWCPQCLLGKARDWLP